MICEIFNFYRQIMISMIIAVAVAVATTSVHQSNSSQSTTNNKRISRDNSFRSLSSILYETRSPFDHQSNRVSNPELINIVTTLNSKNVRVKDNVKISCIRNQTDFDQCTHQRKLKCLGVLKGKCLTFHPHRQLQFVNENYYFKDYQWSRKGSIEFDLSRPYQLVYVNMLICANIKNVSIKAEYKKSNGIWRYVGLFSTSTIYHQDNTLNQANFNSFEHNGNQSEYCFMLKFSLNNIFKSLLQQQQQQLDKSNVYSATWIDNHMHLAKAMRFEFQSQNQSQLKRSSDGNDKIGLFEHWFDIKYVVIEGRCDCNGHASTCVKNSKNQMICKCEHNTSGPNCEQCKPFYADIPWSNANIKYRKNDIGCRACQCNGHTDKCVFNESLYRKSGNQSGGRCIDCRHNTTGVNCDRCQEGFKRNWMVSIQSSNVCIPCSCHHFGSLSNSCDSVTGQCKCKPGVKGRRCDRCKSNYIQSMISYKPCILKSSSIIRNDFKNVIERTNKISSIISNRQLNPFEQTMNLNNIELDKVSMKRKAFNNNNNNWKKHVTELQQPINKSEHSCIQRKCLNIVDKIRKDEFCSAKFVAIIRIKNIIEFSQFRYYSVLVISVLRQRQNKPSKHHPEPNFIRQDLIKCFKNSYEEENDDIQVKCSKNLQVGKKYAIISKEDDLVIKRNRHITWNIYSSQSIFTFLTKSKYIMMKRWALTGICQF